MQILFNSPLAVVFVLAASAAASAFSPLAIAHEHVSLKAVSLDGASAPQEDQPVTAYLQLVTQDGKALGPEDLEIVHEKPFHLFSFDQALTNYQHEHPEPVPAGEGMWKVELKFAQSG